MKKVLLSAAISATLGLTALPSMAQNVDLRMSWWGGNGRHQVTLKALEEFHKQNPDINVKAEYTGWDGHLSRLTTQIAGGTEPDVMQTNWNWLPIFSKTGDGFYDLNKMKDDPPVAVRSQRAANHHRGRQAERHSDLGDGARVLLQ